MRGFQFRRILLITTACLLMAASFLPAMASADEQEHFDTSVFAGKRVGVQVGTVYVETVGDYIDDPDPYYFDGASGVISALLSDKVDVSIGDYPVIAYAASQREGLKAAPIGEVGDNIAFVAPKTEGGEKRIAQLNEFIAAKKADGTLQALQDKWINGTGEDRVLDDYSDLPATNGVLKVAGEIPYAPFEYEDNGMYVGYEIELIVMFAREYGYGLEITSMPFSAALSGVSTGKYDIGASTFTVTEERKESLLFSDVTYVCYAGVIYKEASISETQSFWQNLKDGFTKTFITEDRWADFLDGIRVTLEITLISILAGTLLGFIFHLICRTGRKIPNTITWGFRYIVRGLPVIVLLMILYYLVFGHSDITGEWVAVIGFTIIFTCNVHELLRGAEMAVDKGQAIAAKALGYGEIQTYIEVVFPQAARHFWGPFKSEITAHIKATAVVGYIAVVDLTRVGDIIRGKTYDAFFPLIAVAIIYFILSALLNLVIRILARITAPERRSEKRIMMGVQTHD